MFFRDVYKPIPPIYNLVLAMLWRHPENVELEKVKVVHYCAAVSFITNNTSYFSSESYLNISHIQDSVGVIRSFGFFSGIKTLEVHWKGREHGQGRYQNAGEEMAGHIR